MKKCYKCGEEKAISEFYNDKQRSDGKSSRCKQCEKAKNKSYQERRKKHGKRLGRKKRRKKTREEILEDQKRYAQTERGKYSEYKGQSKVRGIYFNLTRKDFSLFWQKPCHYCGEEINTIGLDRIDSLKGYIVDNVVPCCSQFYCERKPNPLGLGGISPTILLFFILFK